MTFKTISPHDTVSRLINRKLDADNCKMYAKSEIKPTTTAKITDRLESRTDLFSQG